MTFLIWFQFALVCLIGAMSPGPSLAVVIRNNVNYNRMAGILTSLGHGLGIGVYATAAVLGLGLILQANQMVFLIIQISGLCFLFFLGLMFIVQKSSEDLIEEEQRQFNSFLQGFVIAVINPKILIWFTAIYSQFIDIDAGLINKTILVLTPSIIDAIWYSLVAILVTGYGLKEILNKRKFIIQKIIGTLLILIAFSLIYSLISF